MFLRLKHEHIGCIDIVRTITRLCRRRGNNLQQIKLIFFSSVAFPVFSSGLTFFSTVFTFLISFENINHISFDKVRPPCYIIREHDHYNVTIESLLSYDHYCHYRVTILLILKLTMSLLQCPKIHHSQNRKLLLNDSC